MNGSEELEITDEYIKIKNTEKNSLVMHVCEKKLMDVFSEVGCMNGGHILEIGFGMHLSADAVQRQNVKSHTIIEIHPEIYSMALDWAKDKKNVKIILGDWEQVIPKLNFKYDGIMHDVFGLKTSDKFLKIIKPICQENCVVVFAFYKDDENINIYDTVNFTFTDEEYENLPKFPYHSDPFFTKDHFEIRYTTYNNGGFSKRKLNKKLY
jgi:hypothetical protein